MPESDFGPLGERLLRAGIAPRHARRLLDELAAHYALLVEEETGQGQPLDAARSRARTRLGTDDAIVDKAREQISLRSWGARWPIAVCAIAPLLGLAASAVLLMASLVAVFSTVAPTAEPGPWGRFGTTLVGWSMMYGLPLVWMCALTRYSVSRRLSWVWPMTGLILIAAAGAATNFGVVWPHHGLTGGKLSAGFGWTSGGGAGYGIRWLVTLALGLAAYFVSREWLQRRRSTA